MSTPRPKAADCSNARIERLARELGDLSSEELELVERAAELIERGSARA